jgi:hypothetical protein
MGKRQKRLSFVQGIPTGIEEWINYPVTIVKYDNTVNFVKILEAAKETLKVVNTRGKIDIISAALIREIIIDFHA